MATDTAVWTVHVSGEPIGWVQSCVACRFVLIDNKAWPEGRAAVVDTDDRGPTWWPAGARIGTDKTSESRGGCTYVLDEDRDLDNNERLCAGAN